MAFPRLTAASLKIPGIGVSKGTLKEGFKILIDGVPGNTRVVFDIISCIFQLWR